MSGLAHEVPWQLTHVGSHLHVWGAGGGGQDLRAWRFARGYGACHRGLTQVQSITKDKRAH